MKILVAIDNSEFWRQTMEALKSRQWPEKTSFLLLNVVETPTGWFTLHDSPRDQALAEAKTSAESRLKDIMWNLKRKFPACEVLGEVLQGSPADVIVQKAADWDADLVVVGCHGRTDEHHELMGGVSEAVVHRSSCSVEVIKPHVRVEPVSTVTLK